MMGEKAGGQAHSSTTHQKDLKGFGDININLSWDAVHPEQGQLGLMLNDQNVTVNQHLLLGVQF